MPKCFDTRITQLIAAAVLYSAVAHANGTILRIDTAALSKRVPVGAKQHLEACAPGVLGKSFRWQFTADADLDFNVHFHVAVTAPDGARKDVVEYPVKLSAIRRHEGNVTTQNAHPYCWMWSNRSTRPIEVTFTIEPR